MFNKFENNTFFDTVAYRISINLISIFYKYKTRRKPTYVVNILVDGIWGEWTGWSICSVTCEDGIQTRTRLCDNPPRAYGGDYCPGVDTEHKNCTMIPCPSKICVLTCIDTTPFM